MNTQTLITTIAAVASVMIPYLLTQSDVVIPPLVKVALTAANLALVVLARLSNGGTPTTTITTPASAVITTTTENIPPPP